MTSFYEGIVELYRTLDVQEANDYLKTGWEMVKVAEVDAPVGNASSNTMVWRRTVLYVLGRRRDERTFPPPAPQAPQTSHPSPQEERITQKQMDYIKALEKRSPANGPTVIKFLDGKKKSLLELTKVEAGELITRLK